MKIKALTTFLDGADRFEKDDIRTVSDDRGNYFVSQGWALSDTGEVNQPFVGEAKLDVKNSKLGSGDTNG